MILREEFDDEFIDSINGCRASDNYKIPSYIVSGGVFAFMSLSGFIISLSEIIHRETTTGIIMAYISLMDHEFFNNYFERLSSFGIDIICGVFKRLITLCYEKQISDNHIYYWSLIFVCMFIDRFHLKGHKEIRCKSINPKEGLFNSKLIKFKGILNDTDHTVNDSVVEQLWSIINKLYNIKKLPHHKFQFIMFLIRLYYNHKLKQRLHKKHKHNYWDEPIENFSALRCLQPPINFFDSFNDLRRYTKQEFQEAIIANIIYTGQRPLPKPSRISFSKSINIPYKNIFFRYNDIGFIHHPLQYLKNRLYVLIQQWKHQNNILELVSNFVHQEYCARKEECYCELHQPFLNELITNYSQSDFRTVLFQPNLSINICDNFF